MKNLPSRNSGRAKGSHGRSGRSGVIQLDRSSTVATTRPCSSASRASSTVTAWPYTIACQVEIGGSSAPRPTSRFVWTGKRRSMGTTQSTATSADGKIDLNARSHCSWPTRSTAGGAASSEPAAALGPRPGQQAARSPAVTPSRVPIARGSDANVSRTLQSFRSLPRLR